MIQASYHMVTSRVIRSRPKTERNIPQGLVMQPYRSLCSGHELYTWICLVSTRQGNMKGQPRTTNRISAQPVTDVIF